MWIRELSGSYVCMFIMQLRLNKQIKTYANDSERNINRNSPEMEKEKIVNNIHMYVYFTKIY